MIWISRALLLAALVSATIGNAATLIYTNDVLGEIEPCGCRTNPTGGMLRKARFLSLMKDKSLLQLDAGNLLFPTEIIPDDLRDQSELQARYVLKAHDLLNHDAVVPGEKDFALGLRTFEKLRKGSKIKFLAANLRSRSGKKLFEPYSIFIRKNSDGKNIRIAVLGLVGEQLAWPEGLKATSAIAMATQLLPTLRKKADLVVALTHQGYEQDEALAKAVPGIDLIVGGFTQSYLQNPPKIGSTYIYQSSFRNQHIGSVPLVLPFENKDHQLVALDVAYETPLEEPKMAKLIAEFKTALAELNTKEADRLHKMGVNPNSEGSFQTFPRCAECHLKQFDFQRKTQHFKAFHTLVVAQQAKNKECLSCHTVGSGGKGWASVADLGNTTHGALSLEDLDAFLVSVQGAATLDTAVALHRSDEQKLPLRQALGGLNRVWTPVQCENCHGPGVGHPFSGKIAKNVPDDRCLKCHTAQRAPQWYKGGKADAELIAQKKSLIKCPAGELE